MIKTNIGMPALSALQLAFIHELELRAIKFIKYFHVFKFYQSTHLTSHSSVALPKSV